MNLDAVCFYSNDIEKVVDFYTNKLGLALDYRVGDKFVSFKFDNGIRLAIKKANEEREIPGAQTMFMQSKDAKTDYELMKSKGVDFYKELTIEAWGTEFAILDPDKNKIEFQQRK